MSLKCSIMPQIVLFLELLLLFSGDKAVTSGAFTPKTRHTLPLSSSWITLRASASSTVSTNKQKENTKILEKTKDGVYICTEMPPPLPTKLKNTYYLLRHGQSWGNVEGVISSARSLAMSEKHGLTKLGYEQGRDSSVQLLQLVASANENKTGGIRGANKRRLFFYSSPFARARQTAQACLEGLIGAASESKDGDHNNEKNEKLIKELNLDVQKEVIIEHGIMERFFGRLDDEAIHTYAYVWPVDMFDPCHVAFEVESVAAVCTRLRETILKIEESDIHNDSGSGSSSDQGDIVVLTSHADVLQICQLYACGAENVGMFSSYRFTNGEVREMGRSVDSLPKPQPLQPPKPGT